MVESKSLSERERTKKENTERIGVVSEVERKVFTAHETFFLRLYKLWVTQTHPPAIRPSDMKMRTNILQFHLQMNLATRCGHKN